MRHAALPLQRRAKSERKLNLSHWQLFKRAIPFLWPKGQLGLRLRLILCIFLLFVAKLCELAVPFAYAAIIQNLVDNENTGNSLSSIGWPICLYAVFRFSSTLCKELLNVVFAHLSAYVERSVALQVFNHLQSLSLQYHLHRETGSIVRSVSRGANRFSAVLVWLELSLFLQSFGTVARIVFFQISPVFVQVLVVTVFLFVKYDWFFAVITFCTISSYFVYTFITTEWRNKFRRVLNQKDNEFNQKAVDALLNFETVKYFNAQQHEVFRFDGALQEYRQANIISMQTLAMLNIGQNVFITVGILVAMLLSAKQVLQGEMEVGDFVLIVQFILTLYTPLNFLGTYYRMVKQTLIDVENMFELLEVPIDIVDKVNAKPLQLTDAVVEFRNVCFSYGKDQPPVLRDVSFKVGSGESVAVVGPSGAGKSTIARLLYRFWDVRSGTILVDGQPITDVTKDSLRRVIATVPQDCVLFNDTLAYNINYGRAAEAVEAWQMNHKERSSEDALHIDALLKHPIGTDEAEELEKIDMDGVVDAARQAELHDFVSQNSQGYNTLVGERGLRLSGGEKQRVAIARAILKRPRIFIFDEATSSLDTHTEKKIQKTLDRVAKGRSALTIAHRLSTVVNSDKILVLKHGTIVEQGKHEELMELEGEYARMWLRQQEGERLAEVMDRLKQEETREAREEREFARRMSEEEEVENEEKKEEE